MEATRRNFVKGSAAIAAGAVAASIVGTAHAGEEEPAAVSDAATQRLLERGIIGADLPNVAPIPPVPAPDTWDAEADVVIVGMGGGGLMAAGYLAEKGVSVIGVDKDAITGGCARHACSFIDIVGGTEGQKEFGWTGRWGEEPINAVRGNMTANGWSTNYNYVQTLVDNHIEAVEWLVNIPDQQLECIGRGYHAKDLMDGKQNRVMGFNQPVQILSDYVESLGADIRLLTDCEGLVVEDGRVVGIKVEGPEGKYFIRGNKGVILSAGSFGCNRDMVNVWLPSAREAVANGGPMPTHTGEVFRMGLGLGADFAGFDSWSSWEGSIDEITRGGDGRFWHYFWHGERQMMHHPWLAIDRFGNRLPYISDIIPEYAATSKDPVDVVTNLIYMGAIGHRSYKILDSEYATKVRQHITDKPETLAAGGDGCRVLVDEEDLIIPEAKALVSGDWQGEFEAAVERGAVKKADTLEELAEQLGLKPEVVVKAVEDWNELRAKGSDEDFVFPYDPSWLLPIDTPPYYGAIVGGQFGRVFCGLRVNDQLQVVTEDADVIPGLYASWSTSGGLGGEGNWGTYRDRSTLFGGVGVSLVTGYIAAKKLLENEG